MVGVLRIEQSPRVPKTRMRPLHHTPKLLVAPLRVELNPPAFQTGARTRYAREPLIMERSSGFEPVLKKWHSSVLAATLTPLKHWMGRLDSNQRITGFKAPRLTCLATAQQTMAGRPGFGPGIQLSESCVKPLH